MSKGYYHFVKVDRGFFDSRPLKNLKRKTGGVGVGLYTELLLATAEATDAEKEDQNSTAKINQDGYLLYLGEEESFAEEVSQDFGYPLEEVIETLSFLKKHGMMLQDGDKYYFPQYREMTASIKNESKQRADRRKKAKENEQHRQMSENSGQMSDIKEQELELEKEIKPEQEREKEGKQKIDPDAYANEWSMLVKYLRTFYPEAKIDSQSKVVVAKLLSNCGDAMSATKTVRAIGYAVNDYVNHFVEQHKDGEKSKGFLPKLSILLTDQYDVTIAPRLEAEIPDNFKFLYEETVKKEKMDALIDEYPDYKDYIEVHGDIPQYAITKFWDQFWTWVDDSSEGSSFQNIQRQIPSDVEWYNDTDREIAYIKSNTFMGTGGWLYGSYEHFGYGIDYTNFWFRPFEEI